MLCVTLYVTPKPPLGVYTPDDFKFQAFFLFKLTYTSRFLLLLFCVWSFYWSISFGWTINLQYSFLNREHVFDLVNQTICRVRAWMCVCVWRKERNIVFFCRIVVNRTVLITHPAPCESYVVFGCFFFIHEFCRIQNGFKFVFSLSFTSLCVRSAAVWYLWCLFINCSAYIDVEYTKFIESHKYFIALRLLTPSHRWQWGQRHINRAGWNSISIG